MSHHTRPGAPTPTLRLLAAAALVVVTAACGPGGAADSDLVADPGDVTTTTHSRSPATGDPVLDFVQCLRDSGIDIDDPAPGEPVSIGNVDPDDPVVSAIVSDCVSQHLAEGGGRVSVGGNMGENLADIEDLIRFVDCMREHGIVMDDPHPDGRISLPENVAPDSFEFRSALDACIEFLAGGRLMIGNPGGGGTVGRTNP